MDWKETMYEVCLKRASQAGIDYCKAWRDKNPVGDMPSSICIDAQFFVAIAQTLHLATEEEVKASLMYGGLYPAAAKRFAEMPSAIGPMHKRKKNGLDRLTK